MKASFFLLLSCFSWFLLVNTSKDKLARKELASSLATDVREAKFKQKFIDLVQEALDKDLPKLFCNEPSFSVKEKKERYIYKIFEKCPDVSTWSHVFRKVCMDRSIFGDELNKVKEFIPVGLSRILKAEGVDISDLFEFQHAIEDWTRSPKNVSIVYSGIIRSQVNLEKDNLLPSLTWLFVRYRQAYPKKRSILLTPCSEEKQFLIKRQKPNQLKRKRQKKDFSETEEESSNSETEVAELEPIAKRQKVDDNSPANQQENIILSTMPTLIPNNNLQFAHGYSNNTLPNFSPLFHTNQTLNITTNQDFPITTTTTTTSLSPQLPIRSLEVVDDHLEEFIFKKDFIDLVRKAINRKLHVDFIYAPNFRRELSDLEKYIYRLFVGFKDSSNPWASILKKICNDYGIIEHPKVNINVVIPACLRHVLKPEGVDLDQLNLGILRKYWDVSCTNINRVYSKILGVTVKIPQNNIIPSVTYLLLCYMKESDSVKEKSAAEEIQNSEYSIRTPITNSSTNPQLLNISLSSNNLFYNRSTNPSALSPIPNALNYAIEVRNTAQHYPLVPVPSVAPQQHILPASTNFWYSPFAVPYPFTPYINPLNSDQPQAQSSANN